MPKGRIINSCTVDYWTVFMLIMETQVSKLIRQYSIQQNITDKIGLLHSAVGGYILYTPMLCKFMILNRRNNQVKQNFELCTAISCATCHMIGESGGEQGALGDN
jgi:hypothetical protein